MSAASLGAALAKTVTRAGFRVLVHDVRPGATRALVADGATAVGSVGELARAADIAVVVVVNDAQVLDVGRQILACGEPPAVVLIQSTVSPSTIATLTAEASAQGVAVIDAAVSGGAEKAARGSLTIFIGGDDEPVERCRPLLEAMGRERFHLGPPGAGVAGKLVNNALSIAGYALQLEAMELAAAYGIDEDTVASFVSVSSGDCRGLRTWGRHDRIRREHPDGRMALVEVMVKDLAEGTLAAGQRGVVVPLISTAAEALSRKLTRRDAELDRRPPMPPPPRCTACGQELAAPFRARGTHPECCR